MSERYLLSSMVLSRGGTIGLSRAEYETIVQAVENILSCLDAEEKFDCIIENYRDLEQYMLNQAFDSLFGNTPDSIGFQVWRSTTSRKLSNLLSSVRLYQDTIGSHAKHINADELASTKINADKSRQFDSSLSYRALDAIRNYSQHYALPIHGISVAKRTTEARDFFEHEFKAYINVAELAASPKLVSKKVLAELQRGPERLEIKRLVREYVECLSELHYDFRELTKIAVDKQFRIIADARARLFAAFPNEPDALAVYAVNEDDIKVGEETFLSGSLDKYLSFLRNKNRHLVNFARHRVTY